MGAYVCAVGSGKGGVGKSTVAVNLAVAMYRAGADVIIVDADLQMANVAAMLGVDAGRGVHGVLCDEVPLADAIVETPNGMSVVPGSRSLDAFADADPAKLGHIIAALREEYDVVIVDTETGVSHDVVVPLGKADGTLLVTTPNGVAIRDTEKTADLAEQVDGHVLGFVVNFLTAETNVAVLDGELSAPLLGTVPRTATSPTSELLYRTDPSPAAEAFDLFADNLLRVFAGEATAEELDTVYDDEWFESGDGAAGGSGDDGGDDDDDDEVIGLFN